VSAIRERLILLNPFHRQAAPEENSRGLRDCMRWLHEGGLLAMFPAGEVAHLRWSERTVADPDWNTTAARLARKLGCTTVPIFFEGANSIPFQLLGTLYPGLRTLSLPRELVNKRRQTIPIRIGSPIPAAVLRGFRNGELATEYLRSRTFLLRSRACADEKQGPQFGTPAIAPASARSILLRELAALPEHQTFVANEDFTVYCATAQQIPHILREIGREREVTFRQVGEGTRKSVDLDSFDDYYHHLFLWNNRDQRVAGAYRIAATPDVLPSRGLKGLYTSTLFHYDPRFFEHIGPAVELGRSFICSDYQRHYAPLLLLWKGIATYVQRRPECAVVFGAVSISGEYQPVSRELIVKFLASNVPTEIAAWVKPRRGFRPKALLPKDVSTLSRMLSSMDELSSSVSDVEGDGKGVPILVKHYLKLGGQILGFNVDPAFSNALDALVYVNLRVTTDLMLERCMGRAGMAQFRAWHAAQRRS
jgi:putative hemolysin